MKKLLFLIAILPPLFLFTGCPVGIDYPLGYPGKEQINKEIIGTWLTDGEDPDFRKVRIARSDDYSYYVQVFDPGTMYSLDVTEFRAWATTVGGKTFLYAQPIESATGDEQYYLYCFEAVDKNAMKSFDVSLLDGGVDAVSSTESYRRQVETSLKMEGCLSDEKIWTRQ